MVVAFKLYWGDIMLLLVYLNIFRTPAIPGFFVY